jgi:hypothetical protein
MFLNKEYFKNLNFTLLNYNLNMCWLFFNYILFLRNYRKKLRINFFRLLFENKTSKLSETYTYCEGGLEENSYT